MRAYHGIRIFEGIAIGKIRYLDFSAEVKPKKGIGIEAEKARFAKAQQESVAKTKDLYETAKRQLNSKDAEIINAHVLMLEDPDFLGLADKSIQEGYTAEYAAYSAGKTLSDMLKGLNDDYMRQRAADAEEIALTVVKSLQNEDMATILTEPTIIVADDMPSSVLLTLDKRFVLGLVLLKTGTNAHVSILTRTMEIPSIASVQEKFMPADDGKLAVLDGGEGILYVSFTPKFLLAMREKHQRQEEDSKALKALIGLPAVSKDGKHVRLCANIASGAEASVALRNDAEGIGLFRSEFVYLSADDYPSEEQQFIQYKEAVSLMGDKPTIIRTLDIGADKKVGYFRLPDEKNPALGYRSIRICQDRPDVFLTQLTALYRASAFGNLMIMIPMIIDRKEILFARSMCGLAKENLKARGIKFNPDMKMGIMVETPAAAIMADELAPLVDFFSIGTNDLSQYTLAIDRQNQMLTKFFDPHHKAIMRLIKRTVDAGHKAGIPVNICGELARDEELTSFFLKIGVDEFSVSSPYILPLKRRIRGLDVSKTDIDKYLN